MIQGRFGLGSVWFSRIWAERPGGGIERVLSPALNGVILGDVRLDGDGYVGIADFRDYGCEVGLYSSLRYRYQFFLQ